MSVQTQINRIKTNIANAYSAIQEKGGSIPTVANSANLSNAISSISTSGGGPSVSPSPTEVYNSTRPADWLPMPAPADNEMYLLFHIPDGVSSLLAFTVTCTGNYTVALGTVANGAFVQQSAQSVASGAKYEAELFADDWGNLTSDGMKQVMVKVSGTNILTWEPSTHSKKTSPSSYCGWNIMEMSCRLPNGSKIACGNTSSNKALRKLRYFTWVGINNLTDMLNMFNGCYSLTVIPQLDTAKVTNMNNAFSSCYLLTTIPQIDTSKVTNMVNMFNNCKSLVTIPPIDMSKATSINYMFNSCSALVTTPQLNASNAVTMTGVFTGCYNLAAIPQIDTSSLTSANSIFSSCYRLESLQLKPSVTNWSGCALSLSGCSMGRQALVDLFESLPTITSSAALTITGNPGVSELTNDEKAIATGKNWTLTL